MSAVRKHKRPKRTPRTTTKPKVHPAPTIRPETVFQVTTANTNTPAYVTLFVDGRDRRMNPDQRVFVQVTSRFPRDEGGMFWYPTLTVRASELDAIVDTLRATIDEGRRLAVLPEKEDPARTARRLLHPRDPVK